MSYLLTVVRDGAQALARMCKQIPPAPAPLPPPTVVKGDHQVFHLFNTVFKACYLLQSFFFKDLVLISITIKCFVSGAPE